MVYSDLPCEIYNTVNDFYHRARELGDMAYELAKTGNSPEKVTSLNETANTLINLARLHADLNAVAPE